jgi:hypothetical protein
MIGPSPITGRPSLGDRAAIRRQRAIIVISRNSLFDPQPFGQDREEARDVRGDLPSVLAAEIAAEARLPNLTGAPD